jgi:hypothetical protein
VSLIDSYAETSRTGWGRGDQAAASLSYTERSVGLSLSNVSYAVYLHVSMLDVVVTTVRCAGRGSK